MSGNDIGEWYRSIPIVSKYWFTGSVIFPLFGKLGFLDPYTMFLIWAPFIEKFQIWRPITALFYYPVTPMTGFHYLINLYFLYSYSTRLETSERKNSKLYWSGDNGYIKPGLRYRSIFQFCNIVPFLTFTILVHFYLYDIGTFVGKPADYLFMLIFNWFCLVIIGFATPLYLLMEPMIISVLYVWCQLNKDVIVQFWFGTQFKAMYLPWILVAFNMIIQGGGFTDLLGIVVGHLYFFLMFKYPQEFGGNIWLRTPQFMYKFLPNTIGGLSGFGIPPVSRAARGDATSSSRPRFPGRGHTLGD